jgi:hypothetical protein
VEVIDTNTSSLQFLFGVQRQLDHAFEQLIGRQPGKILEQEPEHVKADEVAQLKRAVALTNLDDSPPPRDS